MKTAICFYGQPRFLKLCFDKYFSKVINHYNPDIFVHTWFSEDKIGTHYPTGSTVNQTINLDELLIRNDTITEIQELYKPTRMKYEWYDEEIMKLESSSVICQYYSQKMVKDIKKAYEIENNMKYDLIIRTRFDCVSSNFYDKIKEDCLNIPNTCPNPDVYTDTMSISNSDIYDKVSDAYISITENPELKSRIHGEYAFKHQIEKHAINVNKMPISSDVLRSNMSILGCIDF